MAPRISLITPSYNHGQFLEQTICSVLDQNYPNLEYIIIDGGSSDNSVEIIRKYEKHLAWWVSERDRGQSHAINKGFARATGEVVNWLCSDDYLKPGALRHIGEAFSANEAIDIVVGRTEIIHMEKPELKKIEGPSMADLDDLPWRNLVHQPSCFFRRSLLRPTAVVEDLHYIMDFELWSYFHSIGARWTCIDDVLSVFRYSLVNKTSVGGEKSWKEYGRVYRSYSNDLLWTLTDRLIWRSAIFCRKSRSAMVKATVQRLEWRIASLLRWRYGRKFEHFESLLQTLANQEAAKIRGNGVKV